MNLMHPWRPRTQYTLSRRSSWDVFLLYKHPNWLKVFLLDYPPPAGCSHRVVRVRVDGAARRCWPPDHPAISPCAAVYLRALGSAPWSSRRVANGGLSFAREARRAAWSGVC